MLRAYRDKVILLCAGLFRIGNLDIFRRIYQQNGNFMASFGFQAALPFHCFIGSLKISASFIQQRPRGFQAA